MTGLKVFENVYGEGVRLLNLPATYIREDLPADIKKVAIQEKARKLGSFEDHSRQTADRNQHGDWIDRRSKLLESIRTKRSASK